jgi:hypothetical protein
VEVEAQRYDAKRHIGHDAREPAMGTSRAPLAVRAACRPPGRGELDDELLLVEADGIKL